ncbi:MAG: GntR family transcriptional regulator [Deltaproteobacteria bacterium]|nr:GntR family transcriptional regulator [Deltaproteobacteria bacterium]
MQSQSPKNLIPLYTRVSSIIQNKILSSQYEPGDKLPTEDEQVEYFGVSKITIRNALALLEADGLIFRTRGKGTFVAPVIPETKHFIHTSLNKMSLALERGETKPIDLKKIKVGDSRIPKDIRAFFQMTNQDEIGLISRTSKIKGILYFFENFMPTNITRQITKTELYKEKSIVKLLKKKIGLKITKGEMYLEAVPAEPDISKILQCQSFEPLIHIQTYFWSEPEQPIGLANTYFRSCYFKYKVKVEINSI